MSIDEVISHTVVIANTDADKVDFLTRWNRTGLPSPIFHHGCTFRIGSYNELGVTIGSSEANRSAGHLAVVKMAKTLRWPFVLIIDSNVSIPCDLRSQLNDLLSHIIRNANIIKLGWRASSPCFVNTGVSEFEYLKTEWTTAYIVFERFYSEFERLLNSTLSLDSRCLNQPDTDSIRRFRIFSYKNIFRWRQELKHVSFTGGRLCNQLYYLLQSYLDRSIIYEVPEDNVGNLVQIMDQINRLGMTDLATYVHSLNYDRIHDIKQEVGKDFTIGQLNSFISDRIIQGNELSAAKKWLESLEGLDQDRTVAVHIRATDYLCDHYIKEGKFGGAYDIPTYVENALKVLPAGITDCYVFSDDLGWVREHLNDKLAVRFKNLSYFTHSDALKDLMSLSLFKNKIISNSTFSYWSARIGDVVYGDKGMTILPKTYNKDQLPYTAHMSPHWTAIDPK